MSKNYLTLADLKKQGFKLNKDDAMELHSVISHHAQRGSDDHQVVFEQEEDDEEDTENQITDIDWENDPDDLDPDDDYEQSLQDNDELSDDQEEAFHEKMVKNINISEPDIKDVLGDMADHDSIEDNLFDDNNEVNDNNSSEDHTGIIDTRSRAQKAADTRRANAEKKAAEEAQ